MKLTSFRFALVLCLLVHICSSIALGQATRARITQPIDETRRVTLRGNTHPLARAKFDTGVAPGTTPAPRMLLLLSRTPEQESALQKLLEEQQTEGSPNFRHWLTPEQFGQMFGPADADIQAVTGWLTSQGFQVSRIASGKTAIEFSGTADLVTQAFHTQIHKYAVRGSDYFANSTDPQIPQALAPVVKGIVSLNNFERKPLSRQRGSFKRDVSTGQIQPMFTVSDGSSDYYALGPADFSTIYNTKALLQAGTNGNGQTIAIVGRTNINLQDVADFRSMFGLGAGNTTVVLDGPDPGIIDDDQFEAALDVEWANATAPGASVVFVAASDTVTTSGLDLAAFHVIENNMAGVMSESYGLCEAALGTTGNQFYQALWQQAAAQGITVVIPTGDNGSAGCDDPNTDFIATSGLGVSGFASTPYNVAIGGTDFNDASNFSLYWSTINTPLTLGSAKSYIPEMTWNGSCAATATASALNVCPTMPASGTPPDSLNLWVGSGGPSNCSTSDNTGKCQSGTPKPSWQSGLGVPNDGVRDVPDISLFSAFNTSSNSFYVVCLSTPQSQRECQLSGGYVYFRGAGGTSAAAPNFAAIIALAQQKAGTRLGNVNPLLYSLAAKPGSSCSSSGTQAPGCVFNDVTTGNISIPCAPGSTNCSVTSGTLTGVIVDTNRKPAFPATAGYDVATGLGSVNAGNLVNAIASAVSNFTPTTTTLSLNGSTSLVTANHGDPINVGVTLTPSASTGSVSLLGNNGAIVDSGKLASGGVNWTSTLFPGGNYTVTAHYPGDGTRAASDSNGVQVSISPEPSKTFVNLVTFDYLTGRLISFTDNSTSYGMPYVLRMEVTDATGTVSPLQGATSNCLNGITSCPSGTMTLTANGAALDGGSFALNAIGMAEDPRIQLTPGTYNIVATYPGDPSYSSSNGSTNVTVNKAPVTVTVTLASGPPYEYGRSLQLNVNVSTTSNGVAPTGTVAIYDNGVQISPAQLDYQGFAFNGNGPQAAYASFSARALYTFTTLGAHTVSVQYSGDTNYAGGTSSPLSFDLSKADLSTSFGYVIAPNPTTPNIPVTLTATLFGTASTPTGTITFYDNGAPVAGTVSYDSPYPYYFIATLTANFVQTGQHLISATYSGNANYAAINNQALGTLIVYDKLLTFMGVVDVDLNPSLVNYPTQIRAFVSGSYSYVPAITGTVTFYDNGNPLSGTVTYSNTYSYLAAVLDYTFTTTGTHNITAQFSGDSVYAASQAASLMLPVADKLPTYMSSLNASQNIATQPTNLFISVSGGHPNAGPVIGGTVTFLDGGTPLNTTNTYTISAGYLGASASYIFSTPGTHNLTAQYSGDSNYAPLQSAVSQITIFGPFSVSLDSNTVLMSSGGGTNSASVYVSNNIGTAGNVNVTCTSDSTLASCSIANPQLTLDPYSTQRTTLTYTVPALRSDLHQPRGFWPAHDNVAFAGVFLGAGILMRRRRKLLFSLMMMVLMMALLSCGGGGGGNNGGGGVPIGPSSKSYNFTITVTSGGITASQVLTVTVQ